MATDITDLTDIIARITNPIPKFKETLESIYEPINKLANILNYENQRWILETEKIYKKYQELPEKVKNAIILMAENGWYFDSEITLSALWKIKELIEIGELEMVETTFANHFENKIDHILNYILEEFPHRKRIIQSAFSAHLEEKYELSIPILLAQADGICNEKLGGYFFIKKNGKPETSESILTKDNEFEKALGTIFTISSSINKSRHEREKNYNQMNRHEILHGDSLNYATRINGLKSISFIFHVVQMVSAK